MNFASSYQIINTTKIYSGFIFLSSYPLLRSFWFTYYLQLLASVSIKKTKTKKEAKIQRFMLFSFDNLWLVMLHNSFYLTSLVNYTISIAWMTKNVILFGCVCIYIIQFFEDVYCALFASLLH